MNVSQMHLAIQQGVDKINSLQADMLLQEEIDLELNQAQMKFINTKYGKNNIYQKGLEESQKRIDDLRTLVQEVVLPATFKEQLSTKISVDTVVLPVDYMYLINQLSKVYINSCSPIEANTSTGSLANVFIFDIQDFLNAVHPTSGVSVSFHETNTSSPVVALTLPPHTSGTWAFPANTQELKTIITSPMNSASGGYLPGFPVFWESFQGVNFPGKIIMEVSDLLYPNFDCAQARLIPSSSNLSKTGGVQFLGTPSCGFGVAASGPRLPAKYSDIVTSRNRFSQQDDIFTLLEDPFNTTKYTSPLTTMREEAIDIYTSGIFIIKEVKLTYLRKPAEISLSLSTSCELPDHTHREIVDMAVSSILETIADPRYKTHSNEVNKNE
jgi:hypothetical protein